MGCSSDFLSPTEYGGCIHSVLYMLCTVGKRPGVQAPARGGDARTAETLYSLLLLSLGLENASLAQSGLLV